MTLRINGEDRDFPDFSNEEAMLAGLLAHLDLSGRPVVVELDEEAVLPEAYATTPLHDGARLEIVTIAAGG